MTALPVTIRIPGPPHGKGRPRARRAGPGIQMYTDDATKEAEARVVEAWRAAGEPRWFDAPLTVQLASFHARPKSHFLKDGSYSKAGREAVVCVRKPDLDNVVKLQLDALNGLAYGDDAQVVECFMQKFWAPRRDSWSTLTIGVYTPPDAMERLKESLEQPIRAFDPTPHLR